MSALTSLTKLLIEKQLTIAVAESCTGGGLSSLLTSQSGASEYFDRGFVTYSNQAKMDMLDVFEHTLDEFGAVSEQVAEQMASGAMRHANTDVSVSITGIAGPTGGSVEKPVGTVCFGFCILNRYFATTQSFTGERVQVVEASINFVLTTLINELSN
ncbi:MAG: CinA family protein [Proteobacteria bacterium]|nr:CinA family protein [Pseudomonadota bacterium]MCH9711586.1 CinA family protein [Pseudomonadota bacterium]MCH9749966.1 CinA family protein [Pseudomonadota bacterium]